MNFKNPDPPLAEQDIANVETALGFRLPAAVRSLYIRANGGFPKPSIFEDNNIETVVAEFLPLNSPDPQRTALVTYNLLVRNKRLVPPHFFPFAVDAGGDYFFVNCSDTNGEVYFYNSESRRPEKLVPLKLGFDAFWASLKLE